MIDKLRNVAIIAHVDHGKTTLVDQLLRQSGTLDRKELENERVMDSNDQEKERGITILAKNARIHTEGRQVQLLTELKSIRWDFICFSVVYSAKKEV